MTGGNFYCTENQELKTLLGVSGSFTFDVHEKEGGRRDEVKSIEQEIADLMTDLNNEYLRTRKNAVK